MQNYWHGPSIILFTYTVSTVGLNEIMENHEVTSGYVLHVLTVLNCGKRGLY